MAPSPGSATRASRAGSPGRPRRRPPLHTCLGPGKWPLRPELAEGSTGPARVNLSLHTAPCPRAQDMSSKGPPGSALDIRLTWSPGSINWLADQSRVAGRPPRFAAAAIPACLTAWSAASINTPAPAQDPARVARRIPELTPPCRCSSGELTTERSQGSCPDVASPHCLFSVLPCRSADLAVSCPGWRNRRRGRRGHHFTGAGPLLSLRVILRL